jgi:hypothetical protein
MMHWKSLAIGVLLVSLIALPAQSMGADENKGSLSGAWALKGGETKMEFSGKNVMKILPHGSSEVIVIVCEYTNEKGVVKVKVTDFEGKEEAKKQVKELLPVGTEFSFKWKVTDEAAKLDDVKGEKAETLKSHLEGDYEKK